MPKKVARRDETSIQISMRVTSSIADRADALVEYLSDLRSLAAARSDVYRDALTIGLVTLEERAAKARKK